MAPRKAASSAKAIGPKGTVAISSSAKANPKIDEAGAKAAVTVAHATVEPDKLPGLAGAQDLVAKVIGPAASAKPVKAGEPKPYRVLQRSFIPRSPGTPCVLVEPGETVVFDGEAGSNLALIENPAA